MRVFKGREGMALATIGNQKGQTLVEYGLLLVLIAVVVVAILATLGTTVNSTYNRISNSVSGAANP